MSRLNIYCNLFYNLLTLRVETSNVSTHDPNIDRTNRRTTRQAALSG